MASWVKYALLHIGYIDKPQLVEIEPYCHIEGTGYICTLLLLSLLEYKFVPSSLPHLASVTLACISQYFVVLTEFAGVSRIVFQMLVAAFHYHAHEALKSLFEL